jgi:hypothetical protein
MLELIPRPPAPKTDAVTIFESMNKTANEWDVEGGGI